MLKNIKYLLSILTIFLVVGCEKAENTIKDDGDLVEVIFDLQLGTPQTRFEPILPGDPSDKYDGFNKFPENQAYYPFFDFGMFVCDPLPMGHSNSDECRPYKPDFENSTYEKDGIKYSSLVDEPYYNDINTPIQWYIPQLNHYNNFKAQYGVKVKENDKEVWKKKWLFDYTNFTREKLYIRSKRMAQVFAYYPFTHIPNPRSVSEEGQSSASVYYQNPQYVPVVSGYRDYLVAEPYTLNPTQAGDGTCRIPLKFHHIFTCIQVNMYAKYNVGTPKQGFVYLKSMTLHDAKADSDSDSPGRLSKGGYMDITELDSQSKLPVKHNFYASCNATDSITSVNEPMALVIPTLDEYKDAKEKGNELPSATIFIAMPQPKYLKDGVSYTQNMYLTFKYAVRKDPDLPIDAVGDTDKIYIDGLDKFVIPHSYKDRDGRDKPMKFEPGHRYVFNIVLDNSIDFVPISQEDCWIEEEEMDIII